MGDEPGQWISKLFDIHCPTYHWQWSLDEKPLIVPTTFFSRNKYGQWGLLPQWEPSLRKTVKHNATFKWNEMFDQLFHQSKELLISKVEEGVNAFNTKWQTCLQTNWIKSGIRYLLFQKYCNYSDKKTPVCCSDHWKLVFAGSSFTTPTERWYSPTEGEELAVSWSLENTKMFVIECLDIPNPCICSLKEKTLLYQFKAI